MFLSTYLTLKANLKLETSVLDDELLLLEWISSRF